MGELAWHGSDDLWRLLLLVMVGAFGLALGEAVRYVHNLRIRYRMAERFALSVPTTDEMFTPSTEFAPSTEEEKHGA